MPPRLRMRIKPPSRVFSPVPLQRRSYTDSVEPEPTRGPRFKTQSEKESELIPSGHWYNDIKNRLGKCIMFGCSRGQAQKIGMLLGEVTKEWRDLTAASGGFLVHGNRGFTDQRLPFSETSGWALKYPDTVSTYHKLQAVPSEKDKIIFMNGIVISHKQRRVVAATRETAILFDHFHNRKRIFPSFMLDVFEKLWRQQEDEAKAARERIYELIRSVRKFEKQTWDKEGAVEDMGS
ncbi:hypothetical protein F5Y02DRAFT_416541 [Annulohypoxylon stygium]|nr:hypothetical protein F5Y02DRAFT_416541 [Annulohypoxylon stygium]